jgi:hypothetical protein
LHLTPFYAYNLADMTESSHLTTRDEFNVPQARESIGKAQKADILPTPPFIPGSIDVTTGESKRSHEEAMEKFHELENEYSQRKQEEKMVEEAKQKPISEEPSEMSTMAKPPLPERKNIFQKIGRLFTKKEPQISPTAKTGPEPIEDTVFGPEKKKVSP